MKAIGGEPTKVCTMQNIAKLAHLIWLSEGRPQGQELQYWLEAETMLKQADRRLAASSQKTAENGFESAESRSLAAAV